MAHVLGYIGEISETELKEQNPQNNRIRAIGQSVMEPIYQAGDQIGKMGIEQKYDLTLRGQDGAILEEYDSQGNKVRQLGERKPAAGDSLKLTLDVALQKQAFASLKGKKGAVIASDPQTGEILALVSSPSFDPNFFTIHQDKSEEIAQIINSKDEMMFNRAIGGLYPPGSTFKLVTATAGLEEKKISQETEIEDKGELKVGKWTFGNWYFRQYGRSEGWLDLIKAIKRSNDIFFYKVGEWLGIEKLSTWAKTFGLGQTTGIDLPGEAAGLVPDKQWKKDHKNEDWYLGDDYITAIGQGDLLVTPLQVNRMTSVVANGGKLCPPKLALSSSPKIESCKDLGIKPEYLALLKEGMRGVCSTGGTGYPFFAFGTGGPATTSANFKRIEVACKTGTAESTGEKSLPHAWFTVFAPVENPQIVLTVLLEKGGEGSSVAGPIAKEILQWWFEEKNKN